MVKKSKKERYACVVDRDFNLEDIDLSGCESFTITDYEDVMGAKLDKLKAAGSKVKSGAKVVGSKAKASAQQVKLQTGKGLKKGFSKLKSQVGQFSRMMKQTPVIDLEDIIYGDLPLEKVKLIGGQISKRLIREPLEMVLDDSDIIPEKGILMNFSKTIKRGAKKIYYDLSIGLTKFDKPEPGIKIKIHADWGRPANYMEGKKLTERVVEKILAVVSTIKGL